MIVAIVVVVCYAVGVVVGVHIDVVVRYVDVVDGRIAVDVACH